MKNRLALWVEGRDDVYVVEKFCKQLQLPLRKNIDGNDSSGKDCGIKPKGGKKALLNELFVQLKMASGSDISVLGVILDADTSMQSSWQSVSDHLKKAGYPNVPDAPDENGTILLPPSDDSKQLPKFGIWLMPDNRVSGILEDFLKFLVPDGDTLLAHAERALDELPERRFSDVARPKALMHTWLAWQEDPGRPYGQAIYERYLDTDLPLGHTFSEWLKNLFSDDSSDQQADKFGTPLVRQSPPVATEPGE